MNTTEYLQTWSDSYKNDMISNIMPFWMKYGWAVSYTHLTLPTIYSV